MRIESTVNRKGKIDRCCRGLVQAIVSDRFAVVTVGSEVSSRAIVEKISKREIHGQLPTVLPCNKQSLSFFEGTTRKDAPMEPMQPMGVPNRESLP